MAWVKSDQPGICPICAMELTPIGETQTPLSNSKGLITLSREAVTVANVATELVLRRDIPRAIRVSGVFEAQESRTAIVAAPAGGRVDFVAADHPGMAIRQGETLVRLFSPDLAQRSRFHESRTYERRQIRLGREGDDTWEILSGLTEGERIVTAGNVLIDTQATFEHE